MAWIGIVASTINAALPSVRSGRVVPPRGLEGARVTYMNEGRSGKVVFTQGFNSFEMYFEFGGGDTLAIIDVPAAAEWAERTGLSLAMRSAVLEFIGASVVCDQTTRGKGRFVIHDRSIVIQA